MAPSPTGAGSQALAIAALDPMFGHSNTLEVRAVGAAAARVVDEDRLEAELEPLRDLFDVVAQERVDTLLPPEHHGAVVEFLRSQAGEALVHAERFAMLYPYHDDLPQQTARLYRDDGWVGTAAVERAQKLEEKIAAGHSPSPSMTALLLGARWIRAEDARAFGAFIDSAAGQAWIEARRQAWPKTSGEFARVRSDLVRKGILASGETEDLILPESAYESPAGGR